MKVKIIAAIIGLVICSIDSWALCHVITPTGSGNFSGSDWNNACQGFLNSGTPPNNCFSGNAFGSGNLIRGDTYYIAGSDTVYPYSQGNPTIFDGGAGASVITIKKAIATDHCTDTGYVSTFSTKNAKWIDTAVPQSALIRSPFLIFCDGDHWVLDGQNGDGTANNGGQNGQYGIYLEAQDSFRFGIIAGLPGNCFSGNNSNDVTIRHIEINGVDGSGGEFYFYSCCPQAAGVYSNASAGSNNWKFDHVYFHDIGAQITGTFDNMTVDHVTFLKNYFSPSNHSNAIDNSATAHGLTNLIVRYSLFQDISGTANIACLGPNDTICDGWQIYGNVFYSDPTWVSTNGPLGEVHGTSKIYGDNSSPTLGTWMTNSKFYNNTVVNQNQLGGQNVWIGIQKNTSTGNTAYNNLWYGITSPSQVLTPSTLLVTGDYNSYINVNQAGGGGFVAGPHDQATMSGSPSPFVSGLGNPGDFHLATNNNLWNNGLALMAPFTTDPDGVTRGTPDWSRGAYQFNGPGVPAIRAFIKKSPNSNRPAGTIFPIQLQLVDVNNNPVSSISVTLAVTSGAGMITPSSGTTDSNGLITATVTLDSNPGLNTFVITAGTTTYVLNAAGF